MKKVLVLAAAMLAAVFSAKAEVEFAYEAGADLVSTYLWRGMNNGGLSLQPEGLVGFNANDESIQFRAGVWANLGASDWKFKTDGTEILGVNPNTYFVPEVDFIASFYAYGLSIGFNEYYYCDDGSTHQSEIWFGYNFGELFGQYARAYVNWYTIVAGDDVLPETDLVKLAHGQLEKQAFSSYLEVGYDYTFENIGLTLGAQVGMSPFESPLYGNDKFAVVNISAKIDKEFDLGVCTLNIFAQGSINPNGMVTDKNDAGYNVYIDAAGDLKLYNQKLNGCIGLGVWF